MDEMQFDTLLANKSAEQSIIGGLLIDNNAYDRCQGLSAEMFGHEDMGIIYQAAESLINQNKTVDVISLNAELESHGQAEFVGGLGVLVAIQQATPSAANITRYVDIVRTKHIERSLRAIGGSIQALAASNDGMTAEEKQSEAERLVGALADSVKNESNVSTTADAAREAVVYLDKVCELEDGQIMGMSTGLRQLDRITNGFEAGQLIVIAARTSMGKTVLAENIARHNASHGKKVRFQSYEMTPRELALRAMSAMGEIDHGMLKRGELSQAEWGEMGVSMGAYSSMPMTIDCDSIGVNRIAARCRSQKRKTGLDMLVVDHLLLMPRPNKKNDASELGDISGALKRLAMELKIPIILVCQLNRNTEHRADAKPKLSDIKASGDIEQDADIIIAPYRAAYYNSDANPNEAQLFVLKNRGGELTNDNGLVVGWQGKYQKFTNTVEPWTPPTPEEKQQAHEDDPYGL